MTLTDIESHANNLRQELQIKSNDIKRLTERIDYLERDLQQVKEYFIFNEYFIFYRLSMFLLVKNMNFNYRI
jgi:hypothetical protein